MPAGHERDVPQSMIAPAELKEAAATVASLDAGELFRLHGSFVVRFVARLGVADEELDDCVQEVFLVAHRRGGWSPGPARPTTWLAEIAIRVVSTRRRSARRRRERSDRDRLQSSSCAQDPAVQAEARAALRRVQQALQTLDVDQRAAFVLYELEGQPAIEIAAALGVPEGTVYSRLHRARRRFMEAYAKLGRQAPAPRGPRGRMEVQP